MLDQPPRSEARVQYGLGVSRPGRTHAGHLASLPTGVAIMGRALGVAAHRHLHLRPPRVTLVHYNRRAAELWGHSPAIVGNGQYRFCGAHRLLPAQRRAIAHSPKRPMAELLRTPARPIRDREFHDRATRRHPTHHSRQSRSAVRRGRLAGRRRELLPGHHRPQGLPKRGSSSASNGIATCSKPFPAAIYTTDADGRITFFNQASADLAGRRPVLGRSSWCVTWKLFYARRLADRP